MPGIAGFVLTIGTAVDANVLINERIREERRRGRSIVQSVELGYKEASRTIFEANMTHAISGVIMLVLGSGPVKGFAVVLLIGICDLGVHRGHLHAHAGRDVDPPQQAEDDEHMKLLKLVPDNTNIDFVALRKWAFALTLLLSIVAVGLVAVEGLELRCRFQGWPDDRGEVRRRHPISIRCAPRSTI